MAQFDVCINRGSRRQEYPFLMVVQSRRLDHLPTRLVLPMAVPTSRELSRPTLLPTVNGLTVVMSPHELFAVRTAALGRVIADLDGQSDAVIGRSTT